jgi:hypothetical protein
MGVSGQSHAPPVLYPRERTPGTHLTEGWMDLRAGLDTGTRGKIMSLPEIELRSPVCSQTLY